MLTHIWEQAGPVPFSGSAFKHSSMSVNVHIEFRSFGCIFIHHHGVNDVGESRNLKRTYFLEVSQEAGVLMELWIEIRSSENDDHFVAFSGDGFG